MFAQPRVKKSTLPPPKKRKAVSAVEEVNFDFDQREDYLTGFHKRKQQRIKLAQEQAAKKEREEKIEIRKQVRDDRKREVEDHVNTVNKLLREAQAADSGDDQEINGEDFEEWDGIEEKQSEVIDFEDEYIDEDRFTTVKVEAIAVTRDGFEKLHDNDDSEDEKKEEDEDSEKKAAEEKKTPKARKEWPKKKAKFRYEQKFDRRIEERKQKAKKKAKYKGKE
ncbi:hypothetical protein VD0002_g2206 [Verticillium dahliae]|uniref:Ribosomal RNA-processing protein 17 n=2 Tax=Verticillium dahliae TaxID=27337 RepID=G2WUE7_VERDV|nr:uncharacterized protein VDAG_01420 [Verticillium dahliae VdLs.17]KAF3348256.1 hypothetical protein VdG2_03138 [Verticillium dahliae VDG2]KAH6698557.1 nucleolar protein 12-domain-containing protein [Verticillium dahliae]EGY17738.1 hypothetical protein VDAG_01420 [Verticillium dahliae VdLs.17]PNH35522.1 hypothetical protein BJF96_g1427 [Verticillium dahliae]PNH56232.1 hypothetical protein VD0003_g1491 [Verticillium dahliae]